MFENAIRNFEPRPRTKGLHWSRDNVQGEDGRPYDHLAYPHIGAPGGPWDAFDDPRIKTIWLQWASRCGKTFFGLCCLLLSAAINPCPMMFASAVEKLAIEVTSRLYKMCERIASVACQLRPHKFRRQDRVDFDFCRCFVSWSRSVSTLADKDVRLGLANEIDKWEHQTTSKEADPLKLFDDRFKNFPSHKKIKDSTPTIKGRSRVERGRLQSTNCLYHVPCPHCGEYQTLKMDRLKWDKNEAGKSTTELARTTARYECEACAAAMLDHHRTGMMRNGVWCPEGCTVDAAKAREAVALHRAWASGAGDCYEWAGWSKATWVVGHPARDGTDAGYQLSSLYALTLGWGDIAAEFVGCKDKPQDLRNFINQWLAETWEIISRKQTWEQLGERMIDRDLPRGIVPDWASLITVGADRQLEHFVYVVEAWGPGRSNATIHYGDADDLESIRDEVLIRKWKYADGGTLPVAFTLADSGFRPEGIYDFCRDCQRMGVNVGPCKGSSVALNADYRIATLGKDTSAPGQRLVHVDTIRTQGWIDKQLHSLKRGDVGAATLFNAPMAEHQDFLEQLLNEAAVIAHDAHNNDRENWERIDTGVPNDFRDCRRYAYAAMLIATRGKPIAGRVRPKRERREAVGQANGVQFLDRPGGWIPGR